MEAAGDGERVLVEVVVVVVVVAVGGGCEDCEFDGIQGV